MSTVLLVETFKWAFLDVVVFIRYPKVETVNQLRMCGVAYSPEV
jgi:hypothetical protein